MQAIPSRMSVPEWLHERRYKTGWELPKKSRIIVGFIHDNPLHGHHADRKPIRIHHFDTLFDLSHQPCLAGLPGRPDREKMAAFARLANDMMQAVLNQIHTRHTEMDVFVHRAIGVKTSHGDYLQNSDRMVFPFRFIMAIIIPPHPGWPALVQFTVWIGSTNHKESKDYVLSQYTWRSSHVSR